MADDPQKSRDALRQQFFPEGGWLDVHRDADCIPLVAANLSRSTRSFSEGQRVYVYDGFFGMNERVKVAGRYRRKHRVILGVCPTKKLRDHRLVVVYEPAVLRALHGVRIHLATLLAQSGTQPG